MNITTGKLTTPSRFEVSVAARRRLRERCECRSQDSHTQDEMFGGSRYGTRSGGGFVDFFAHLQDLRPNKIREGKTAAKSRVQFHALAAHSTY